MLSAVLLLSLSSPPSPLAGSCAPEAGPCPEATTDVPEATPPDASTAEPEADPGGLAQAKADVEVILTDTSRRYLEARARLVADPVAGATALLDRLEATPPPGPAERKRILDVLAELSRPEDLARFADELRRAVLQASSPTHAVEAAERWRPLLLQQGEGAVGVLEELVGDRRLPAEVRALLLDDLVTQSPSERLVGYAALLGRGQASLQTTLERALERRAARDPQDHATILASLDVALATPQALAPRDFAARLRLRARLGGSDPALLQRLERLALDPAAEFGHRIAAVDGLARQAALGPLETIARQALAGPTAPAQAAEIVATVALHRLAQDAPERVEGIADATDLHRMPTPRLAVVGLRHGTLAGDANWLPTALANPWPQVRQTALERVRSTCRAPELQRVTPLVSVPERGGDPDRAVTRAALAVLGHCTTPATSRALVRVLRDDAHHLDVRAEAGRQLVRHAGAKGVDAVARTLRRHPGRRLERRLAVALRYAAAPTPLATRVLCSRVDDPTEVAGEAAATLATWYPEGRDVCGDDDARPSPPRETFTDEDAPDDLVAP